MKSIVPTVVSYHSKKVGQITIETESNPTKISTQRLILHSINQDNREELIAHITKLMGSSENTALFQEGQVWGEEKVIQFVDQAMNKWENTRLGVLAVREAATNEFIGNLHIDYNSDEYFTLFEKHKNVAEIGYILDKKFWGKGYGTEIAIAGKKYIKHMIATGKFKYPIEEIVATAHPENYGSVNILRKTLKQSEDKIITRYEHPRMFFFKQLNKIQTDLPTAMYGDTPLVEKINNISC